MPQQVAIPGVGMVSFPDGMSNEDIGVAAKKLHDNFVSKRDANMKAQEGAGKQDLLSDFAHSGAMGVNLEGLNAAHEGNYAKATHKLIEGSALAAAPAAIPALGSVAGVAGLGAGLIGGVAGTGAARGAAGLVTDNPDYIDLAGDIGGLAGGAGAAKAGAAAPGMVGRGMSAVGDLMEGTPTVKQMIGTLLKKGGGKLTAPPPVPGLDRNMPNKSSGPVAMRLFGRSAEGVGTLPENLATNAERITPNISPADSARQRFAPSAEGAGGPSVSSLVDRTMPNTGADPAAMRLYGNSAENIPAEPLIQHNTTPPSQTGNIPEAYRAPMVDKLATDRASRNMTFDDLMRQVDESGVPAQVPFIDTLPAPESMSMADILKGPGTMTPEASRVPSGRGVDPRIAAIGDDVGANAEQTARLEGNTDKGLNDVTAQLLQALQGGETSGIPSFDVVEPGMGAVPPEFADAFAAQLRARTPGMTLNPAKRMPKAWLPFQSYSGGPK